MRPRSQTPRIVRNRPCLFCAHKVEPDYKDTAGLFRYINDRGRIVASARSGACSYHQRRVACAIKRARHLALVPFVTKVA